ncbi:hypothetical protein J6590_086343 [Homalodisca vitripennis]|nr:hypothetical protein J6590_086343 [Homalodisca vitripennis]
MGDLAKVDNLRYVACFDCEDVNVETGSERFTVLAVYRSPSNDGDLELFISDLERYCDSRVRDRTYWIVGNINCCNIWTYCTRIYSRHGTYSSLHRSYFRRRS